MKHMVQKTMLAFMALVMTGSMAFAAITIDAAKSQGLVGEQQNGLVGVVAAPTAEVTELVTSVNKERMDKYLAIAAKNGTDVLKVQVLAGQKLTGQASAGEYVQDAAGTWHKK
jgi:hypothetical protein